MDLYHIPGDAGGDWRLNKFIEYQHKVRPVHPLLLAEYAIRKNLSEDDCIYLSWLLSVSYCEITAIVMFESINWDASDSEIQEYWTKNKPLLIFQSARTHAKNKGWVIPLMIQFKGLIESSPSDWLHKLVGSSPEESYSNIFKSITTIKYVGRFSGDLMLEMLTTFQDIGKVQVKLHHTVLMDWRNCDNMTSGTFNLLYMDEEANRYDRHEGIDPVNIPILQEKLDSIIQAIQSLTPEVDVDPSLVIGKICSFRNLFKNARYGGFHHDRQLGNIRKYELTCPDKSDLWNLLYSIRSSIFHPTLLGEVEGWNGIRPERKKIFLTTGCTGVEQVPSNSCLYVDDIYNRSIGSPYRKLDSYQKQAQGLDAFM